MIAAEKVEVKKLPDSQVEMTGEIPAEELARMRPRALAALAKHLSIPGFRAGHVPARIAAERLGEMKILEEAVEIAMGEMVPEIITREKLSLAAPPEVTITKLAPGNPAAFRIRAYIMPEITLPDYRAIVKKELGIAEENAEVSAENVESFITDIRKRATGAKSAGERDGGAAGEGGATGNNMAPLPDLTDEFVRKLGAFTDVADFRKKVRENLLEEKALRAREKRRARIAEHLIAGTTFELPPPLIENELDRMEAEWNDNLERLGLKADEYLKKVGKTREALRGEWRESAAKRVRLQLLLFKIALAESISVPEKELQEKTSRIVERHKGADSARVRSYLTTILTNEKVFEFLESQKTP
ncbi:MAG: TIG Trigger factor [Parcubacteria group bacterium Gr01-1014_72]|nr:MAG: TIG Trigger factor [Parcubacteria group bacterium Gr01-1014_72]